MIKQFLIVGAIATTLIACNNATTNANTDNTDSTKITSTTETGNELDASMQSNPGNQNITTAPTAGTQDNKAASGALNPEHGQPGHRCDIAVGAPLNSPPGNSAAPVEAKPATQAPQTQPVQMQAPTPQQMPAPKTEPGFSGKPNPAHGQPGHRCDLEVGVTLP